MGLLDGRIAIVTGAAQGLGEAIAARFAAEGAQVAMLDRNAPALAAARARIGARAEAHPLDVTDADAFGRVVDALAARFGRIDVLVNNAAVNPPARTLLEDDPADWRRTLAIDLDAVYLGSKRVAPVMAAAGSGAVIHVSSVQGFASSGRCGAYNAAKGGLIGLTKSMAVELAPHGVRVNALAPGFIDTPMAVVDGVNELETPEFRDWYVGRGRIPLRRAAAPAEIAGAALFLASDLSAYVTGHVLVADGGLTATF